jgi:hypothetical protein
MLTLESLKPDKKLSVFLAIKFAEKALPIWEAQHPEDNRPRVAIEAAQACLNNPTVDAAAYAAANARAVAHAARATTDAWAVAHAARAAGNAARDADDAARAAGNAARDADDAARAARAVNAAADAAYNTRAAAYAVYNARAVAHTANAADSAAYALGKDKASFIHSVLMENAGVILEHMVKEEVAS